MDMGGKVVQGQKRCHFFRVKGLGIQPDAEILLKICLICHGKVAEIRADQLHGVAENVPAGLQHLRQACAVAQDVPELFLPGFIAVKNMLHKIEYTENIGIGLHHDHAAAVIKCRQIPVLPKADQAHVFTERRSCGQMIRRADVGSVSFEVLIPIKVKLRPHQRQLRTASAIKLDLPKRFFQTPIQNIRAQLHKRSLRSISLLLLYSDRMWLSTRKPYKVYG